MAQGPILSFPFGTIEVLGCSSKNALVNSTFSLGSYAYVIAASHPQFIYDMIAIDSLFTNGVCLCHVSIIAHFG